MFVCCPSLFVSVQVYDAYVNVLSIIVFFSLNIRFDMLLYLKSLISICWEQTEHLEEPSKCEDNTKLDLQETG